ncbi:2-succinyl-6-hydroxy-2,4-cyclohexadiene-1-carboxylate synthase [compost metagenome]
MNPRAVDSTTASAGADVRQKIQDVSVVFIHGFLDEGALWLPVRERLAELGITSVAPDLSGMGARASAPPPFTLSRLAEDVATVIAGIAQPVVLVGHSMGAQIAELVAARLPRQVIAMMLLTPVPLSGLAVPDDIATQMCSLGGDAEAQRQLRRQFAGRHAQGVIEGLVNVGMKVRPETVGALFSAWSSGVRSGDEKSAFQGRVLIAGGEEDAFIAPALIDAMVSPRFTGASTVVIPEVGHWPHVEQPSAVAKLLTDFLSDLAVAAEQ